MADTLDISELRSEPHIIPDRPLATIVRIQNILPIKGADRIVIAQINGWNCIVKKDEFKIGELAIYFCIDSIPDFTDPNMKFLVDMGIKRIKTIKMRDTISQGLLGPLKWLTDRGHDITAIAEADDVTERMGVTKYVEVEEMGQYVMGKDMPEFSERWPINIPKTDEDRLQNNLKYLDMIMDREIVITRKEDGCSCTFIFNEGKTSVCSRNMVIFPGNRNGQHYFFVEKKFNICEKMIAYGRNLAIQGEIIGPSINGNKLKLSEYKYEVFNIYDISKQHYLAYDEVCEICKILGLDQVPLIYKGLSNALSFKAGTFGSILASDKRKLLDEFLKLADSLEYAKGCHAEGIVVKTLDNWTSFKVISNEYLLSSDKESKKEKK